MKPQEDSQEDLQKALALKRHEQPPPQYFRSLSDEVLERLHHPQANPKPPGWSARFGFGEDWKPWMVAVILIACIGLTAGVVAALLVPEPEPTLSDSRPEDNVYAPGQEPEADNLPPGFTSLPDSEEGSTMPVMSPGDP